VRVILDASAAVEIALNRGKATQFAQTLEAADEVMAPDLLVPEVVNTIWKYHEFEKLGLIACDYAIEQALGLVDGLVSCGDLHREAFHLSRTTRRPAYDMFYLALARREDATLITMDAALRREAERQGIRVL